MKNLIGLLFILSFIGSSQSFQIEDYLHDHPIRVRIRNQDTDELDAKILRERTEELLRRQKEEDPELERRLRDEDLHRREIDPSYVMSLREQTMSLTNEVLVHDIEVHLRTYLSLKDVDYGNDVVRSQKEEWLTITKMDDTFGGYTIRSENKLFVPYSMAGYRTTVSPLEEMHDNNNRWDITWVTENTIRLSLGPTRMMKERYPTVNDHHIAPNTLGNLYVSQTEYLWTFGADRGRRAEFLLEMHPDLVIKLDLKLPIEVTTAKDCEKLKKHRDCIYKSQCRWMDGKCRLFTIEPTENTNTIRKLQETEEDVVVVQPETTVVVNGDEQPEDEVSPEGEPTLDGQGTVVTVTDAEIVDGEIVFDGELEPLDGELIPADGEFVPETFDGEFVPGLTDGEAEVVIEPVDGEVIFDGEIIVDVDVVVDEDIVVVVEETEEEVLPTDGELDFDGEEVVDGEVIVVGVEDGELPVEPDVFDGECKMLGEELLDEAELTELNSTFDATTYEINNSFKTSHRLDTNCFRVELEVSSATTPIDITQDQRTIVDGENNMISFTFSIDDLDRYCYKLWDHPQYDCIYTFRILQGDKAIVSWWITQHIGYNRPEGTVSMGISDIMKTQHSFSDINIGVDSELMVTEEDYETPHVGPFEQGQYLYVVHRILDGELQSRFYLRLIAAQLIGGDQTVNLQPYGLQISDVDQSSGWYKFNVPMPGFFSLRIVSELVDREEPTRRQLFIQKYDSTAEVYEQRADKLIQIEVIPSTSGKTRQDSEDSNSNTAIIVVAVIAGILLLIIIGGVVIYKMKSNKKKIKQRQIDEFNVNQLQKEVDMENRSQ